DWRLADPRVSQKARHDEQLEIEGEPLDREQRHRLLQHLLPEQLQASLSVPDVQPKEQAHEQLVRKALEAAKAWIGELRQGVSFGANHSVALEVLHEVNK